VIAVGEFKITREGTLMRVLAVATSLWLLSGATVGAVDSRNIPVPILNGQVNDAANVLSIEDQERLSKLLRDYEKETKHQIAVLTVPTLAGGVPIALTVHISRRGECAVTKVTMPCDGVGAYVKALNAQPRCDIHIEVTRESQYQIVASALGSLKKARFWNVGFENNNK
jgi:hypothetical protein